MEKGSENWSGPEGQPDKAEGIDLADVLREEDEELGELDLENLLRGENEETTDETETDTAGEKIDDAEREYIERQLGQGALEGLAIDTATSDEDIENLAKQRAVDQLQYEKQQRIDAIARASGIKKVGLSLANMVQSNSIVQAVKMAGWTGRGGAYKKALDHIKETGSAYAVERNGESNYDATRGMTAGDESIIEKFKRAIQMDGEEGSEMGDVLGAGDKLEGVDEEKTAELKSRLTKMVDRISGGDKEAWEDYQKWVEKAREEGYFTGREGEYQGVSADNIMEMGQRVRNIANNLRKNESGLEKVKEYIDENTALYTGETKVGINTRVRLDEMSSLAMKGGVFGVVGLAAARRVSNSTVAKVGSAGAFAAVAGVFGAAKGKFDAETTISQIDQARALGRSDKKAGTGMFAKMKMNSEIVKENDFDRVSVKEALEELNVNREMSHEDLMEMADYLGELRAKMNVGSKKNIDFITYDVAEDGDLGEIEEQKNELTWAMAEAMRHLRKAHMEDQYDYEAMVEKAEGEWEDELGLETEEVANERKRYKARVIAETAVTSAVIAGSARLAKEFLLPWMQENHPETLPKFLRGETADAGVVKAAAKEASGTVSTEDAEEIAKGAEVKVSAAGAFYSGEKVAEAADASEYYTGEGVSLEKAEGIVSTTDRLGPALRLKEDGSYELLGDIDGDREFATLDGLDDIKYNGGRMDQGSIENIMQKLGYDSYSIERVDAEAPAGTENVLSLADRNLGEHTVSFSDARIDGDDYVINVWSRNGSEANVDGMKYFIQPDRASGNNVLAYDVHGGEIRIPRDSIGGQMFSQKGNEIDFNGNVQGVIEVDDNGFAVTHASMGGNNTVGEVNLAEVAKASKDAAGERTYDYVFRDSNGRELRIESPLRTYAENNAATHYQGDGLSRAVRMEESVNLGNGELHAVDSIGGHSVNVDRMYLDSMKVNGNAHFESPSLGRNLVEGDVITPENMAEVDATRVAQRLTRNIATNSRQAEMMDVMLGERDNITSIDQLNARGHSLEMSDASFDRYNNGVVDKFMQKVNGYTAKLEPLEGNARATTYVNTLANGEKEFVSAPSIANKDTDVMLVFEDAEGNNVFEDSPELRELLNVPEGVEIKQIGWLPKCGQAAVTYDAPRGNISTLVNEDEFTVTPPEPTPTPEETPNYDQPERVRRNINRQAEIPEEEEEEVVRRVVEEERVERIEPEETVRRIEPEPGTEPTPENPMPDTPISPEGNTPKNPAESANMSNGYVGYTEDVNETSPLGADQRDNTLEFNRETGTFENPNATGTDNPAASAEGGYDQSGAGRVSTTLTDDQQAQQAADEAAQAAADADFDRQQEAAEEAISRGQEAIAREQEESDFMSGYGGGNDWSDDAGDDVDMSVFSDTSASDYGGGGDETIDEGF